jgi:phenylacetate-CoA ligase
MKAMFESQYETMPRPEIVQLQLERLQATLSRVYRNVKFYRQKFDQIGSPRISSPHDLGNSLSPSKRLVQLYPYGMFAYSREVVRSILLSAVPAIPWSSATQS